MNLLTQHENGFILARTAPHWAGGFCRPKFPGAEVMRRQAHGFFYASRFMVGGVLGGLKACRILDPVCKPDTSSTAICFAALVGGLKPQSRSYTMNTQVAGEVRPTKTTKIPNFISEACGKYRATKALTDKQIIKAAKAILDNSFRPGAALCGSEDAKTWLRIHYQDFEHEVFVGIFLDSQHRVIAHEILSKGTIDGASVYPREVAKRSLKLNAAAVIFAHNHPSGLAEPSVADESITCKLKASLALLDIKMLDHLILGKGGVYSFAAHNLI